MCATTKNGAELIQINWLKVTGCIDNINVAKKTSFDVGFTVSLMTDAFDWSDSPVYLMAKWGNNQWRTQYFHKVGSRYKK
ncbi:hypothetical protein H5410_007143 [Solanum commersonii]|uniref:Uncharacterized protein n=1 Tax=Solanum commersonii TaxID=4109 RepID=A0A9J6AB98_SOLCO|nr:hypothetical protein H5410_007143 [Solanum commersonii]